MKSSSLKHIDQIKQELRDILISKGITDEAEIEYRINYYLHPKRNHLETVRPGDRVYPDADGKLRRIKDISKSDE